MALPAVQAFGSPGHGASVKVAPRQDFRAFVNAKNGKAVIRVLCPGVAATGHPLSHQTVRVTRIIDPITPNDGLTGSAGTSIGAWLTWPTRVAPAPPAYIATFTRYRTLRIPTSIAVPCSGSGEMLFLPTPGSSTVKAGAVSVTFVNLGGQHERAGLVARP